ncbi:MAG: heavy metal sensor histidine kinase, partial [Burkholderiales bacterium]|nr:heavy metal sensor histidine kinase [Burkholderiales bacterium]
MNAGGLRSGARSIRARITAFIVLSSLLLFSGFAYVVRQSAQAHFAELDNAELDGKIALARSVIEKIRTPADIESARKSLATALVGHPGVTIRIVGKDGAALVALVNPPQRTGHGTPDLRTRSERFSNPVLGDVRIEAALDFSHHEAFLDELLTTLVIAVVVAVPLAGLLGWLVAGRALRPVAQLTQRAKAVSAQNLQGRVDAHPVPPELEELASAFDAMLARLHDSFERLDDYSVDLAHELRTPLNNVITQTEVALSRTRDAEEYRETLYAALEQCRRLARMIADMLFIARAEKGLLVPERVDVDLAGTAGKVVEYFQPLAADSDVNLAVHGAARIVGDSLMIERAIANLLSNAIRHAAAGATVNISIEAGDDEVVLAVLNRGENISADRIARLFDRFYRADAGHPRAGEGTGLGLAIAKAIVEAHGGRVLATSRDG